MPFAREIADKIRRQISERLDANALPIALSSKMFAGYGTGLPCAACDDLIQPDEVEYEFDIDGRSIRFHLECAALWQAECRRRGEDGRKTLTRGPG